MSSDTTAAAAIEPVQSGRYDIYAGIHRALRLFMNDTLGRLGQIDCDDPVDVAATLDQLNLLMHTCRMHLEKENRYVHPAIEAGERGGSSRIAHEHEAHLEEIAALEADAAMLRAAPNAAGALRLYRHLALFVAENFTHMNFEETAHNEALWARYSDAEILAIEGRLVASIGMEDRGTVLHWMTRALPPAERAAWLGGMRAHMPPEPFHGVLAAARRALDDERAWHKLSTALGLGAVAA